MTHFIKKALLAAAGMALVFGQTTPRPAFDVASVKLSKRPKEAGVTNVNPQGINYVGVSLRMTLAEAYNVKWPSMSSPDGRIREMLDEGTYDIAAKTDHPVPKDQLMLMLQTLLADRFKLTLHIESKVEPVYRLVVAKDGPKLKESAAGGELSVNGVPTGAGLDVHNMTMSVFSRYLTSRMGRVVVDQTGLEGQYDFVLKVGGLPSLDEARAAVSPNASPDAAKTAMSAALNDWSSSSVFADIQKQLGLKLEADKAPVDNLVVDHVEKPSEN
jgi:uncharacterized protein (TIGR03435 family)